MCCRWPVGLILSPRAACVPQIFSESIYSLPRCVFSARSNPSETNKEMKVRTTSERDSMRRSERDSTSEVSVRSSQTASERTARVRGTDTARIDVRVSVSGNKGERGRVSSVLVAGARPFGSHGSHSKGHRDSC